MYYVSVGNSEIRCDTVEEALELAGRLGKLPAARVSENGRTTASGDEPAKETGRKLKMARQALAFIEAVKGAGEKGIGGQRLADEIGCAGTAGIGTVVQNTNRFLMEAKLEFGDVVEKIRIGDEKLWKPGDNIDAGEKALRKKADVLTNANA